MASPRRHRTRDLAHELEHSTHQFRFFQAVRLLGLMAPTPQRQRGRLPERLRFRSLASLSFPPSELVSYRQALRAEPAREDLDELVVSFMGLIGPSGALPVAYTELVIERKERMKDATLHAFFDLFSHRSIAMFYAAWSKYRFWVGVEAGERDGFSRNLLDLAGVGLSQLRERLQANPALPDNLFRYYAGLLSQKPLSAGVLAQVTQGLLGVPAQIKQFVGHWIALPPEEQSRLGRQADQLGFSAFAGNRIWDRQSKLSLRLGPMPRRAFSQLMPGSAGAQALHALMQFALGHSLAVEVTLVLDRREIGAACLASQTQLTLGGDVWLHGRSGLLDHDPDDMRYALIR